MLPTIGNWLVEASQALVGISSSAGLDAELILAFVTKRSREQLLTGSGEQLSFWQLLKANYYLYLRKHLMPVAYILHRRKFWGLSFYVNRDVMIPRPETENLVQMALEYIRKLPDLDSEPVIADIGCGAGVIGLSLHYETLYPVILSDVSSRALRVAKKNARRLKIGGVRFVRSNLLTRLDLSEIDVLCANLPYVDKNWDFISESTKFEPSLALFARKNGLEIIEKLLGQLADRLTGRSRPLAIFLEADTSQMKAIAALARTVFIKPRIRVDGFTMQILI